MGAGSLLGLASCGKRGLKVLEGCSAEITGERLEGFDVRGRLGVAWPALWQLVCLTERLPDLTHRRQAGVCLAERQQVSLSESARVIGARDGSKRWAVLGRPVLDRRLCHPSSPSELGRGQRLVVGQRLVRHSWRVAALTGAS